jgi:5-methylcytosine-specific restriction endonuclease McrA
MVNKYNISQQLEDKIRGRDKECVYCKTRLKEYRGIIGTPKDKATFEHIDNDGPSEKWNVAMCCQSCNSSKKERRLKEWLNSSYCKKKNITREKVAQIVREFLKNNN